MSYRDQVTQVVADVIEPAARDVDKRGTFPRQGIEALGRAGLLGLTVSADHGGGGGGPAEASYVIEQVARACGSTAMVLLMHYAATAILEAHGSDDVRSEIAAGRHLTTLAFSEAGSRSHFWAPVSSARAEGDEVVLDATKSWVTSEGEADSYVWSSRPLDGDGPMTLWQVPSNAPGLKVTSAFDGLGLRGNASSPVTGIAVRVPGGARLGEDGAGFDVAFATVLPNFLILNAAFSVGLMEAVIARTTEHLTGTRLEHLGQTLAEQPSARGGLARMRITADSTRTLLNDTLAALGAGREDAQLRVLQIKAAAAEASIAVTDLAMTVCGGSAFRPDLGIERRFRDSRAARVWADAARQLYVSGLARQWNPDTEVEWGAEFTLPAEIEGAVVQVMTYLIENEYAALQIPAKFIARLHPHYREVMQVLSLQVADEARHVEVFTRRAMLRSDELGVSGAGGRASLQTLLDEPDFSLAAFLLSVLGEGSFLELLAFIARHAPDPVTRRVADLALRDERRHVAFGQAHLKYAVEADGAMLGRLRDAAERRHAALADTAGLNADVFDSLIILAAHEWSAEAITNGWNAVQQLQYDMDQGRQRRLVQLGFPTDEAVELSALHTRNFM